MKVLTTAPHMHLGPFGTLRLGLESQEIPTKLEGQTEQIKLDIEKVASSIAASKTSYSVKFGSFSDSPQNDGGTMRRRVKFWSGSVPILVSLSILLISRGAQPATLLQQPLLHHPPHDPALIHPEMAVSTATRVNDWGVSKTIIQSSHRLVAPVIDGAETPDRIPDDVALRVLLGTNALPAAPSAKELARVNAKLARLGLDAQDL